MRYNPKDYQITFEQIENAMREGLPVMVIINGEYYDLVAREEKDNGSR